jgi:phosphoglycolate phosphatase-like HAD superfamily hydrolase
MLTRVVLFDVDGTLVDTGGAGRRAMVEAFRTIFRVERADERTAKVYFAGSTDPTILEDLADSLDVPRDELRRRETELCEAYYAALQGEMANGDGNGGVLPGVEPLLRESEADSDCFVALVTGNLERGARIKLSPFGLNRFFPVGGFGSDHRDRSRLARIAAQRVAERFDREVTPADVVLVGDTPSDVEAARANGYTAVAVTTGWSLREQLDALGPDALLDSLADRGATRQALGFVDR